MQVCSYLDPNFVRLNNQWSIFPNIWTCMLKACAHQYFILVGWEYCCQILYATHYCTVNFLSSCKTKPVYNQTKTKVYVEFKMEKSK